MKITILKTPIVAGLLVCLASSTPLFSQNLDRRVNGDANASASAEGGGSSSGGSSSSFSETSSKKVVIINGKKVVDESTHTINGDEVDQGEDNPESGNKPWLGLRAEEASSALRDQLGLGEKEGIVVVDIVKESPAEKADLRENDILLKFEGTPLGSPNDLQDALDDQVVGQTVTIEYLRRGQKSEVDVTLERNPGKGGFDLSPNGQKQMEEMMERMKEMMNRNGAGGGANIQIEGVDANLNNLPANGGGNSIQIEVNGGNLQDLDAILDNPNLPEEFKRTVRDMWKRMEQFGVEKDRK